MAKIKAKCLYSQSEEDEYDKQLVYDTMYKTRCSLFCAYYAPLC